MLSLGVELMNNKWIFYFIRNCKIIYSVYTILHENFGCSGASQHLLLTFFFFFFFKFCNTGGCVVVFHHFYLHFHSANDYEYLFLCLFTIFITLMIQFSSFSSVAHSCPTLQPHESQHTRPPCPSPTPGVYPTHVHRVSDVIQPSILCCPLLLPPIPPRMRTFSMSQLFT